MSDIAFKRPSGCGCYPGLVCRLCQRAAAGIPLPPSAPCGEPDCGCGCSDQKLAITFKTANGLGDAVCGLYAACGLAEIAAKPVYLRTRYWEWLAGVSHPGVSVVPEMAAAFDPSSDYDGQLLAAAAGTCPSRVQWYCDRMAEQFHLGVFSGRRPTVAVPEPVIGTGYIAATPFSAHGSREWPSAKWSSLTARLASAGRKIVVLGDHSHEDRLRRLFSGVSCEWFWGMSPAWVTAVVANASLVVGNDSGLVHVAGLYGVPAVAVMSHLSPEFVFGDLAPSVRGVRPDEKEWPCRGCGWRTDYGYKQRCDSGCAALQSISVDRVRASCA